jgi:hypothetical protein
MKTEFRIGRVLSVGARLWARNLVPLVLLTAVAHAPLIIWGCAIAQGEPDHRQFFAIVSFESLLYSLVIAANGLAAGLVAPGLIKQLQGQRLTFLARIGRGLARAHAAFGTLLFAAIYFAVMCFIAAIPLTAARLPSAGAICGILVGLYFYVRFYVAIPASVIERPGPYEALARSGDLSKGHRAAILGLLLVLIVGSAVLGGIVLATTGAIGRLAPSAPVPDLRPWLYIELVRSVLVGSFVATLPTVAYYFLRSEKQGTSPDELAVIFE